MAKRPATLSVLLQEERNLARRPVAASLISIITGEVERICSEVRCLAVLRSPHPGAEFLALQASASSTATGSARVGSFAIAQPISLPSRCISSISLRSACGWRMSAPASSIPQVFRGSRDRRSCRKIPTAALVRLLSAVAREFFP